MSATPVTHLNFHGEARAALEFYATAFGGEAAIRTYADLGMPAGLPDSDRVVFGQVFAPGGFTVMAYDVPGVPDGAGAADGESTPRPHASAPATPASTRRENGMTITTAPFFLALNADTLDEATEHWNALSAGAAVVEPLAASAWSPGFGMLTDRFGITWVLSVTAPQQS
jgi:PhnB protein